MESRIKVLETPRKMYEAFERTDFYSIRWMKPTDDPEPELGGDEWWQKYGDKKLNYVVIVRYPETCKPLAENSLYKSWNEVEKQLRESQKARLT